MSFACAVRGDTAAVHAPAGPWPPSLRKEGEGPPPAKWKPWEVLLAVGAVASEGLTVLAEPEPAQQLLTQHRQRLYPCGAPAELPVLKRQRLENYAGPRDQQWQWQPTLLAPACGQPLLHAQHWRWQQQLATPPALPAAHAWTAAPPLWAQCNAQQPTAQHLAPPLVQAPLPPPVPVTPLGAAAQQFATRRTSSTSGSAQEGEASLADGTETSASVEGGGALPAALPHVTLPAELCRRMLRLLGLCMAALHAAAARDAAAAAPTRQHQASHVQPTAAPSVGGLPQRPAPGSAPGPAAAGISAGALDLLAAASRAQQARLASPLLDATSCAAHKQRLQLTPMQRVVLGVMAAARLEDRVSRRAPAIGGLEARGRGGRRRWCTGQNIALLLTATLVSAWVWGDGPQPRPDRSELQLSPATAGARATLYSSDGGDVALLAVDSASAEALLAAARPEAVARAAARNRRAAAGGDPAGVQPGEGGVAAEQHAALREQVAGGADANAGGGTNAASEAAQQQLGEQAAQEQAEEEQLWKIEEEPLSEEGQAGGAAKDVAAAGAAASQLGAAPAAATGPCNNSMVVVLTSHKTGTAQTGCIVEMLEQRYVPQGAARHDHHPDSLHAVAQFAAQRLPTSFSGGIGRAGSTYCPSVKFYSSGHHLPRLEDEGCPGTLPCPCKGEQEQCLAVDAGTIDIPPGNTTVVQVIRQPINVILSAYQYHTQEHVPEGEEWLQEMTMGNFSGWMYSGGVPYEALDALGAHDSPQESYYSFLRRLEPDLGVKLQFWFSSWELYGFARQYASLAVQPGITFLPVRFEDLQDAYNTTVRGMLLAFKERLPAIDVDWLLGDTGEPQLQACHISRWNPKHRAEHRWEHVTSNKNPELRKRLRGVLMADSEIAPRLCQLSAMFGYDPDPECGALEGEGDADGGGGGATDDDLLP